MQVSHPIENSGRGGAIHQAVFEAVINECQRFHSENRPDSKKSYGGLRSLRNCSRNIRGMTFSFFFDSPPLNFFLDLFQIENIRKMAIVNG